MFDGATDTERDILTTLEGGALTSTEIAKRIGKRPNETRPRLSELHKAGRVQRDGERPPYSYSLPTPASGVALGELLQDTSLLQGARQRTAVPLPTALLEKLWRRVGEGRLEDRLKAPDMCDYLAAGGLLVLELLERGGQDAKQLELLLRDMRQETRERQKRKV